MAKKAFLLIQTGGSKSNEVVAAIKQLGKEDIKSVDSVTGPYEIIAVIEGTLSEIGDLVTGEIGSVAGVSRVVTCLVI